MLAWGIGSGFGFGDAFDTAYVRIYTMMAVQGVVWLMAIQTVCALAVIVWHRRHKHPDSFWVVVVAPVIAIVGQVFALYLLFANIDMLAGTIGYVDLIDWIAVVGADDRAGLRVLAQADQPQEVRHDRPDDRRGGRDALGGARGRAAPASTAVGSGGPGGRRRGGWATHDKQAAAPHPT